uniref:Ig-like domain-containing protein n=1 Tax=Poecilia reticulata TaxID=8081 RepID=A0A3P9NJK5_POERE
MVVFIVCCHASLLFCLLIVFLAAVSHRVSVILHPSWPQIYREETVILRCQIQEAGGTEWTYEWKTTNRKSLIPCEYMNFSATEAHSGEYSCRGRREGRLFIDLLTFSVWLPHTPARPVTAGEPVTLSCTDKTQKLLSGVFFYHNDKLLDRGSRGELNISAVSKSDEGFYKCQHSGKDSPRIWKSGLQRSAAGLVTELTAFVF